MALPLYWFEDNPLREEMCLAGTLEKPLRLLEAADA